MKFALPPRQNPNASQWNIGCVGSSTQNFRIGHVHFMLFVLISFALVTQREPSLQWNMDFCLSLLSARTYKISNMSNIVCGPSNHLFVGCYKTEFIVSVSSVTELSEVWNNQRNWSANLFIHSGKCFFVSTNLSVKVFTLVSQFCQLMEPALKVRQHLAAADLQYSHLSLTCFLLAIGKTIYHT